MKLSIITRRRFFSVAAATISSVSSVVGVGNNIELFYKWPNNSSPCGSCTGGDHCGFPCDRYQKYYKQETGTALFKGISDMNNGCVEGYGPRFKRPYRRVA